MAVVKTNLNPRFFSVVLQKFSQHILFVILILMLALIPLLVRVVPIDHLSPIINLNSLLDSGKRYDIYTYYKLVFLTAGAIILLFIFIFKMIRGQIQIKRNYTTLPLLILILFILISGLFAEYKTRSFVGQLDRKEGTLTYLNYLILFFVSTNIGFTEKKAKWLIYALYPMVIVNFLLSLLSFYDINLIKSSSIFEFIILPASLPKSGFAEGSMIKNTFCNIDFASGIGAVLTILFLTRAVLVLGLKEKIINISFSLMSFSLMLSSMATGGFVSFVFLLPLVFLFIFTNKNQRKKGLYTGITALIAFGLIFTTLNSYNSRVAKESIGFFSDLGNIVQQTFPVTDQTKSGSLVTNKDLTDKKPVTAADEFNLPPMGFAPGNGRFYVWEKTINLIIKKPIFGYGLDTLVYYFPLDDPYKNSGLGNPDSIVDKPHNMYLGIAFGSGIIALLAFLILIFRHFMVNIRLLRKPMNYERRIILASLFSAWCAYLIQAFFNDSVIGTAVVFWILFGASVSMLREELSNE